MLAELGQREGQSRSALDIAPPPSIEDLRIAEAVFHEPEQRLLHEFFWFWPLDMHAAEPDPALVALQAGDTKSAGKIWLMTSKDSQAPASQVAIAKHNIGIYFHLKALDIEVATQGACWEGSDKDSPRDVWTVALTRWNDTNRSDAIWNAISARVIALNDDRLSLEFVQAMRNSIGAALLKINGALALKYAAAGISGGATAHLTLALGTARHPANPSSIEEFVAAPMRARVRQSIQEAAKATTSNPNLGDKHSARLLTILACYRPLLNQLETLETSCNFEGLHDEVAEQCLSCAVAFHKATNNDEKATAILDEAIALAKSPELRKKIAANIETGKGNQLWGQLKVVLGPLVSVEESKAPPAERLVSFLVTVEPQLRFVEHVLVQSSSIRATLWDRIAGLLRDIAVDAWNMTSDGATSLDALGRADRYAVSEAIKEQLAEDRAILTRNYAEKRREAEEKKKKKFGGVAVVVAIVALLVFFNWDSDSTFDSSSKSTGSVTSVEERTYRIPQYIEAELTRDREAAEAAQAEAKQLGDQLLTLQAQHEARLRQAQDAQVELENLSAKLERERVLIDAADSTAVDRFNAEVAHYNSLLARVEELTAYADELVDPYNELLARTKDKSQEADRLVDAYNLKLEKHGR